MGRQKSSKAAAHVAGIQFKEDQVIILLDDGTELEPANISQVNETVKESAMMQASMMIGKMVSYLNEQQEEVAERFSLFLLIKGKNILSLK